MNHTYRYVTADVLTGITLEELPLDCQRFDVALSGVGGLTATLPLGDLGNLDWRAATIPRRTSINVITDDRGIAWSGIIMKRRPVNNGTGAELTAETWEGYLARRRLKATKVYTAQDPLDITFDLLSTIQAVIGGNIRLGMTGAAAAGYIQTVTYYDYQRVKILDEIKRLAEVAPGFEYWVSTAQNPSTGIFTPTLNVAAPTAGAGLPAVVCEHPGNVVSYDYPEDGTRAANAVTGIGKGDGAVAVEYEVVDTLGEIAAGYPIFEDELNIKEEDDLGRLTARTKVDLTARLVDYVVPTVTLRGDADPHLGDWVLGQSCVLRATSMYHPAGVNGTPGLNVTRRITGWSVQPPAAGRQETVTLTLASGLGKIVPPLDDKAFARYLADIENRVRNAETRR